MYELHCVSMLDVLHVSSGDISSFESRNIAIVKMLCYCYAPLYYHLLLLHVSKPS